MDAEQAPVAGQVRAEQIEAIRALIQGNPQAHRRRLSELLCEQWDWKNLKGQAKDMAARNLMLKLHRQGQIILPPTRRPATNAQRGRRTPPPPSTGPALSCSLVQVQPISLERVDPPNPDRGLLQSLLAHHHYLGYRGSAGENMQYMVWSSNRQPLACLVFEAAAWKVAVRDRWLGWDRSERQRHLQEIANNSRFLIPPWIKIPHLASHVLARATARLRRDWFDKYGHGIELVETFVDRSRFQGTCYRAANWIRLGSTQGRGRNDAQRTVRPAIKDIYVYPLNPKFRQRLGGTDA